MATDKDPTFQDILLELMVANETLDKIEKNTASLIPLLTTPVKGDGSMPSNLDPVKVEVINPDPVKVDVISPDPITVDVINPDPVKIEVEPAKAMRGEEGESSVYTCCDQILKCVEGIKLGIDYLASETTLSGGVLIEIRNTLIGMREDADLDRLKNLERDREASNSSRTTARATQVRAGRAMPEIPGMSLGGIVKTGLTAIAALKVIPAFFRSFIRSFTTQVFKSFNPKNIAMGFGKLAVRILTSITRRLSPYLTSISDVFKRLASKTKALYRLKVESTPIGEFAKGLRKTFSIFSKEYLKTTMANLKGILKQPIDPELMKGIRKTFSMLTAPITGFFSGLASKSAQLMGIVSARSGLTKYLEEIRLAWQEVTMAFRGIGRTFSGVSQGTGYIARFATTFKEVISFTARMGSVFEKIGTALGKLFGFLGRILPGLDLIISGFTFITTWSNTAGDAIAKLEAAGDAALDSLIGWVYDLPKSIIGWIVGNFDKDLGKAISDTSFKDTIIPALKRMWTMVIEAMLDMLPKSISNWMLGIDNKGGVELNTDRKVKMKDPVVLENGARTLADPNMPPGTKQRTLQILTEKYGFTKQEVDDAVQVKLGKPLKDQVVPVTAQTETPVTMETQPGKPAKFLELAPVESRIVNLQESMDTANISGAKMSAYQSETEDLKAKASFTPTFAPLPPVTPPVVNSSNVNSVIYNNTNIPDRTQLGLTPAFGY